MNPRMFIEVIQDVLVPVIPLWNDTLQSVLTLLCAEMDRYVDSRIEAKLAEKQVLVNPYMGEQDNELE